ncbi:MAG: lamin tail domain-containing protein [Myxococcaceae bacterium]|nr:lamin tail domain-containing protein [Myxococcaceae bacterium]
MIRRQLVLSSLGLVALAACPPSPAPDPLPEPPRIVRFVASPTNVARGETVTLKWETSSAANTEVVDLNRGSIAAVADVQTGEVTVAVNQPTVFVLSAKNSRGVRVSSIASVQVDGVDAAGIVFAAYPPVLRAGQPGVLVWNAPNARKVEIAPMGGAALNLAGQVASGSVEVNPTTTETTYVLTADGERRTATVARAQGITEFTSSKLQVRAGDQVTLSWKTVNATRVRLTGAGRGTITETMDAAQVAMGSFMDTLGPQLDGSSVNYVLEVEGRGPVERQTLTLVYGAAPEVLSVTAPTYVKENLTFRLEWTTVGADRVEVRQGPAVVYRTPAGTPVASGFVELPAPTGSQDYLVAAIASGSRAEDTETVRVTTVVDVGMPTFTAAPTTIPTGGTPVTLTWNAPGAVRTRIIENETMTVVAVEGAQAAMGTATVYPNRPNSTYQLNASNTLEPAVTATANVTVTAPALMTVADGGTIFQTQGAGVVAWTVGGAGSQLVGFGSPSAVVTANSTGFTDISTTGTPVRFPGGANDAILSFAPIDFETFLGGRRVETLAWVSTNGFVLASATAQTNSRPAPAAIPGTSATTVPEDLVAPFWANLEIGPMGGVHWQIVGDAPNRELVVQWTRMRVVGQPTSQLTFQARIHQAGAVAFEYQTMTIPTPVSAVTIGYQGPLGLGYTFSAPASTDGGTTSVTPAAMSRVAWGAAATSPAEVTTLAAPGAGLVRIGTGGLRLEFDQIVKPTDIIVSEVMNRPNAALPRGQWLEFTNFSNATIDLGGWTVGDTSGDAGTTITLPGTIPLAPRTFVVVAQSGDPVENDNLPSSTIAAPGLTLPPFGETVRIANSQGFVSTLPLRFATTDGGPSPAPGISLAFDPGPFVNRGALSTAPFTGGLCPATAGQTFGNLSPSQRGSPGLGNDGVCIGYRLSTIPVNFKDISTTGQVVTFSNSDDAIATVDISSAPTQTFGVSTTSVTVSTNGWMVPKTYTGDSALTNKVSPNTTQPDVGGVIAPFWDDLQFLPATRPGSGFYRQRFGAGADPMEPRPHWVFLWHRIETFLNVDDMTFEVKLFDDGTIEYHYGTMMSATTANRATGNQATVWLEDNAAPAQRALVHSVNRASLRSNMALRFTRVP